MKIEWTFWTKWSNLPNEALSKQHIRRLSWDHMFLTIFSKKHHFKKNNVYFESNLKKYFFCPYHCKYQHSRRSTSLRSFCFAHMTKYINTSRKGTLFVITMKKSCFGHNSFNVSISTKRKLFRDDFENIVFLSIFLKIITFRVKGRFFRWL